VSYRLKALANEVGTGQRQARALRYASALDDDIGLQDMLAIKARSLQDARDQALISLAYDIGARRGEIVQAQRWHVVRDWTGTLMCIPKSKTSVAAQFAAVSAQTCNLLAKYARKAELPPITKDDVGQDMPLFTIIDHEDRNTGRRIHAVELHKTIKRWVRRAAEAKALPERVVSELVSQYSTHSCRVGNAQDARAKGISLAAIAVNLRWTSVAMPLRYTDRLAPDQTLAGQALASRRARGRDKRPF
jgi:integrase